MEAGDSKYNINEAFAEIVRNGTGSFSVEEHDLNTHDNPLIDSDEEDEPKAKIEEKNLFKGTLKGLKFKGPRPIDELDMDDLMLDSFWPIAEKMKFLTEDGKVRKRLIRPGNGIPIPPLARVSILYTIVLEMADEPMDNQTKRPFTFKLEAGSVIPALEIGVSSMECKEVSKFFSTYEYAYGKLGIPDKVPPESNIMIKIEVLSFIDGGQLTPRDIWELDPKEREKLGFSEIESFVLISSQEAKDMINEGNFRDAGNKYRMSIRILEEALYCDERETSRVGLLFNAYSNLSFVLLKRERWAKAAEAAKSALKEGSNFVKKSLVAKAYYRLAKANLEMNKSDAALDAINQAMKLDSSQNEIKALKLQVEDRIAAEGVAMKEMAQKMFNLSMNK